MKVIILFLCMFGLAVTTIANETVESNNIRVREWNEFQETQEEILTEQRRLFGEIGHIREKLNQLNLNILSWQEINNEIVNIAGKEVHCDLYKTKYDPRVEYTVIGLAVVGIFLVFSKVNQFFVGFSKKKSE